MDKQANDSAFFSPQGATKCQNIETMLSLMAMAGGISEHMLTSWSSCVCINIYFVSKISQELLYLETWNLVHLTSMTSCIVGRKIGATGPGPLELFPFVLAICVCVNIYLFQRFLKNYYT